MYDFNDAFHVNTTACFYTLVASMPFLDAGNKSDVSNCSGVKSHIIVTSSIGAMSRRPGMGFAYSASNMAGCAYDEAAFDHDGGLEAGNSRE
jgi:NAD(P)-dependent dehydrogenase (short-subunit alcohol dehydrogenase family)